MEENLRNNNIKGIHLGVMEDNPAAINFYKKNGYELIKKHFFNEDAGFVLFLGKKLI